MRHAGRSTSILLVLALGSVADVYAQALIGDPIVYSVPDMSDVRVDHGVKFKTGSDGRTFSFDIYHARSSGTGPAPVVVFVNAGGLEVRRWAAYTSWARLVAASGVTGVVYDALDPTNADDLQDVVAFLRDQAGRFGVDGDRVAIWASSRNVAVALPFLADEGGPYVRAAVLYYGVTDPDIPLRREIPWLIARAGLDAPALNRGIDAQVAAALRGDIDLTFFNYRRGQHAFDVRDDTEESRRIIAATVDFLAARLGDVPYAAPVAPSPTSLWYSVQDAGEDEIPRLIRDYAEAVDNPTVTTAAVNSLGYLLLGDGRTAEAISAFRVNVEIHPDYANGFDSLGEALATAGRREEAIRMYDRAVELDPDGPTGQNAREQLEQLRGDGG